MHRTPSLEKKFDLKSQHMGIVSIATSSEKGLVATSSIDGFVCIRASDTGCFAEYVLQLGLPVKSVTLGPMEVWPIVLTSDVQSSTFIHV